MKRRLGPLALFTWGAISFCSALVFADDSRRDLETYGDSLTAGFLSNTSLVAPPPLSGTDKSISAIVTDLANYLFNGDKEKLAKHHAPDVAWPEQLAKMLTAADGQPYTVVNRAVSGARVADLLSQVERADRSNGGIAFFFIGHNDLCNSAETPETLSAHFQKQYKKALAAWDARHDGATAYIIPVSEMQRLFHLLKGYVWYQSPTKRFACEDAWERLFPYCPSYSKKLKAGTLDDYLVPRLNSINRTIADVTSDFAHTSKKNRYVYAADVLSKPFEKDYFAIDCYHLSNVGQKRVAEEAASLLARKP